MSSKAYTGAENGIRRNIAHNIIVELTAGLEGLGHILYHDSYFSYYKTAKYLAEKNFGLHRDSDKEQKELIFGYKKT